MFKKIVLALLLNSTLFMYSQNIQFIEKNDTLEKPKYQQFIYITENTSLVKSKQVAKIKVTGSLKDVANLFLTIKREAQKIGANSFKFESFNKIDSENGELILTTYYNEDDFFDDNFKNIPKNKVYVFGNQNLLENRSQGYKVNGEKFEIESGKFKEFEIKVGEELKINKGGFTGMSLWITGKEEGYCSFISFSGIGIVGAGFNPRGGGGINITTGSINRIEPNMGFALLKIFSAIQ